MEAHWPVARTALRSLVRRPGFTCVVVLTLALGIGANTAIFSFVYAVLLRPFPYRDPQRLVRVSAVLTTEGGRETSSSLLDVEDYARESRAFAAIGAYTDFDTEIRGDGQAQAVRMAQLNEGALRALGVSPILGRLFLPDEDRTGGDVNKALISYGLWQSRFGGDPNVLGRIIQTSFAAFTVVGVMPPAFGFPGRADVWTPMESWYAVQAGPRRTKIRSQRYYAVIARLQPLSTLRDAEADLNGVAATLAKRYPSNVGVRVKLRTLRDAETGDIRPYLLMISAAVGLVLLICCVNVAGLLLSRAIGLRREFAVRAALGASRARLLRLSLTESLLLALAGGVLGVALAYGSVALLLRLIPVPLPAWMRIELDPPALVFALLISLITMALFGLAPGVMLSRSDVHAALKENSRTATGGNARLRSALVVAQLGLTLLLLVGAGLLTQTFLRLQHQDTGFDADGVLVARALNFFRPGTRAAQAAELAHFHEQVLARLRALPGVVSAAGTGGLPYTRTSRERGRGRLRVRGVSNEELRLQLPLSGADVSPDYFKTLNIPLMRGRLIDDRDTPTSPMVVLVSERAAKTLWPDRDAIGQELFWGANDPSPENPYCVVVGIVGNVRTLAGEADDGLEFYYPYTQYPVANVHYLVRTSGDPRSYARAVRQVVQSVDQNSAIVFVESMQQIIADSLWQPRLWSVLLAAFGIVSLVLAGVGIYGLLSYMVTQRTREIGLRIALGARPGAIRMLVLGQIARLLTIAVTLGLLAFLALRRILAGLLFGVSAGDPLNLLMSIAILAAATLVGCYLPARRASSVDPLTALRQE